jgi:hypothetical protein
MRDHGRIDMVRALPPPRFAVAQARTSRSIWWRKLPTISIPG